MAKQKAEAVTAAVGRRALTIAESLRAHLAEAEEAWCGFPRRNELRAVRLLVAAAAAKTGFDGIADRPGPDLLREAARMMAVVAEDAGGIACQAPVRAPLPAPSSTSDGQDGAASSKAGANTATDPTPRGGRRRAPIDRTEASPAAITAAIGGEAARPGQRPTTADRRPRQVRRSAPGSTAFDREGWPAAALGVSRIGSRTCR
jgi:hypothetical protein